MSQSPIKSPLKLDRWAASSLLQKAIRRGEVELAQQAVAILHRYRGQAVWRRLASIALEDVGIADPALVWDAVRLATEQEARASQYADGLIALTSRLAAAPKDRSADYLYCGATKLETALHDRTIFDGLSFEEKVSIATGDFEPLTRRAVAALSACTSYKGDRLIVDEEASRTFAGDFVRIPETLLRSMMVLTGRNSHPFGLMLMLIWSHYDFTGGASGYSRPPLPEAEHLGRIPLYIFDKHTAVGKKAIPKLAEQSPPVRDVLARWVPRDRWADVTLMAAFYADAAPVAHRLEWFASELLEFVGLHADMAAAGCPGAGAQPVLDCVRQNLTRLNQLRHSALVQDRSQA